MPTSVTAAHLLTDTGLLADPIITVEDGIITAIGSREDAMPSGRHINYAGATLAPAFLDIHAHGCAGRDVMEATPEALAAIGRFFARHGVGAYLPTTVSAPEDAALRSLAGLAKLLAQEPGPGEARPLGLHLEGPFLSHSKRGAHAARDLQPPSLALFNRMWEAAEGRVALMTVAPELPGALELIEHAISLGVRISIGHTDALAAQARAAITAGAASATHTFNAMRGLTQREPGTAGTVLAADSLYAELICDGLHIDPSIVTLFARAKPTNRAILVTDAMSATGMPDGSYKLGELDVRVAGGRCLVGEDTLAGSTLTLDRAVSNYITFTGVPLAQALAAVTRNPARMLGLERAAALLAPGAPASFNVLSPEGELLAAWIGGTAIER